jgi:hypothetical protein
MAEKKSANSASGGPARRRAASSVTAKKYVSKKISLKSIEKGFTRADLEFEGVDHSGASFEARVFLNNSKADVKTARTIDEGYAGSFHIFGHGGCFGDVGHCDVHGLPRPYDPRPAHQLTPARKVVIATEAVRAAVDKGTAMTVTVVPVVTGGTSKCDFQNVLKFDRVSIITYL